MGGRGEEVVFESGKSWWGELTAVNYRIKPATQVFLCPSCSLFFWKQAGFEISLKIGDPWLAHFSALHQRI